MSIYTGVLINFAIIVAGGLVGTIFKSEKLKRLGDAAFKAFAFFIMAVGFSGASEMGDPVKFICFLAFGTILGELMDIDKALNRLGEKIQDAISKKDDGGNSNFAETFVSCSLLYCIGAMAITGAMESVFQNKYTIYTTKGVLDGLTGLIIAMKNGPAVAAAGISVVVYQGLLVALCNLLAPVLTAETIAMCGAVGNLLLVPIGFNMLGITQIKVANMLPAMFMPMIWQAVTMIF